MPREPVLDVRDLTMAYGSFVVMSDLTFDVGRGEIFIIMGGSGCGKSTLMKHAIGLKAPSEGTVHFEGTDFWAAGEEERRSMLKRMGVMYQQGALWS